VNEQAFGRPAEADLVDALRRRGSLPFSLVAVEAGQLIGHIAFGFAPARTFGITCEFPVPDEVIMELELTAGALAGRGGRVRARVWCRVREGRSAVWRSLA
jgi:predicted N-acetyltransferase YhbS